jgi:hypothetical protein
MTPLVYAETLGNNCRVLKLNKEEAATVADQNALLQDKHVDDFWHGYFYGRAYEVTPLPSAVA